MMPNMTRDDAVKHLIAVLSGDIQMMLREKLITEAEADVDQRKDYAALVALGVTPDEITEAQARL